MFLRALALHLQETEIWYYLPRNNSLMWLDEGNILFLCNVVGQGNYQHIFTHSGSRLRDIMVVKDNRRCTGLLVGKS